ncbi:19212_t:CDS:2, partial [Cetraspora pellucida]
PKTSTTNIAAHLCTEHQIFKTQKWDASPTTTVNPTSVTLLTFETIIQKQIENTLPLSEKQQNRIAYRLVAWIVKEMMPLNFLVEWDMFDKISVVITDNTSSMNKVIRQLGTPHLGCTAHIIYLVIMDGLKQCETLIGHAKSLNNFLVNRDKYRSLFRKIQHEMIEKKNNDNATKLTTNMSVLDPISKLATNLTNNPDCTIRADSNNLNKKILTDEEWTGLEEICQILHLFAQALTFIGGDHYPTLSMMYPAVRHLFKVLDQIEYMLTNLEAIEMHQSLRTSMFATFLDPCFKTLSTTSFTIQKEVIKELCKKIELSNQKNTLPTTNQALNTEMSSFFDDEIEPSSLSRIDTEFQVYFSIPPIPKYDLKNPHYEEYNLLSWWKEHKCALPLLAE